mgnify:CR=1 FL=1
MNTPVFSKSADTSIIENRLRNTQAGDTVSYDDLSRLIGRDVRAHCQSNLRSARKTLIAESIFFACVANTGFTRLTAEEAVVAADSYRQHIGRTARRGLKHLQHVALEDLTPETRKRHVAMAAQLGAVELFSSSKATKKLESKIDQSTSAVAIGETLKLFGG